MVRLGTGAAGAIRGFLGARGSAIAVRVELRSDGCCDPSLALRADRVREGDLVEVIDGLTFALSPEVYRLCGEVTIIYRDEPGDKGFVITSTHPVSEWAGFGTSTIKV